MLKLYLTSKIGGINSGEETNSLRNIKCTTDLPALGPSNMHHWRLKECSEEVLLHSCPACMLLPLSAAAGDTALEGPQTWIGKVLFLFLWLSIARLTQKSWARVALSNSIILVHWIILEMDGQGSKQQSSFQERFFFPSLTKSWKKVRCYLNQSFQYRSLLGIISLLEP